MKKKQRERVEKGASERKGSLLRRRILHVRENGGGGERGEEGGGVAGWGGGGGGGGGGRATYCGQALHRGETSPPDLGARFWVHTEAMGWELRGRG